MFAVRDKVWLYHPSSSVAEAELRGRAGAPPGEMLHIGLWNQVPEMLSGAEWGPGCSLMGSELPACAKDVKVPHSQASGRTRRVSAGVRSATSGSCGWRPEALLWSP